MTVIELNGQLYQKIDRGTADKPRRIKWHQQHNWDKATKWLREPLGSVQSGEYLVIDDGIYHVNKVAAAFGSLDVFVDFIRHNTQLQRLQAENVGYDVFQLDIAEHVESGVVYEYLNAGQWCRKSTGAYLVSGVYYRIKTNEVVA